MACREPESSSAWRLLAAEVEFSSSFEGCTCSNILRPSLLAMMCLRGSPIRPFFNSLPKSWTYSRKKSWYLRTRFQESEPPRLLVCGAWDSPNAVGPEVCWRPGQTISSAILTDSQLPRCIGYFTKNIHRPHSVRAKKSTNLLDRRPSSNSDF